VGNSLVVTVNSADVKRLGLAAGDFVVTTITAVEVMRRPAPEYSGALTRAVDAVRVALEMLSDD
jgi:hypothetical protein